MRLQQPRTERDAGSPTHTKLICGSARRSRSGALVLTTHNPSDVNP
jgi:hypothetical protein